MKLSDFDFNLPEDLIALNPVKPRDSSKLLRISSSDIYEDTTFNKLTNFLKKGDVLVVNDTRVIPSKIFGYKVNLEKELTKISFTFFFLLNWNVTFFQCCKTFFIYWIIPK